MFPFPYLKSAINLMSHQMRSRFFLCLLFLISSMGLRAQWETVNTLEKDWSVYQKTWGTFLPYVPNQHYSYHSKSLFVHPKEYPKGYLTIDADNQYFLFLNGAFQRKLEKGQLVQISLDSLQKVSPSKPFFVLTFYAQNLEGLPQKISIQQRYLGDKISKSDFLNFRNRNTQVFYNFFSFSFFSLLALLGLLIAFFPKYFHAYFRFSDWIHFELKDEVIIKRPFAFPNLLVIFILSLVIACISFFNGMRHQSKDTFFDSPENFQSLGTIAIFLCSKTAFAFMLFLMRYLMYRLFSSLFKLDYLAEAHFYKSMQTNFQFFILLFLGIGIFALSAGPLFKPNLTQISYLVDAYFLIRTIYYFRLFRRNFRFNQISLFAYILIMEGQVLFFGLRELIFPEYI